MSENVQELDAGMSSHRELIAFAFVEDAYSKTGDLVAGLMPLFAPILAKRPGRVFNPTEFADEVQKTYDIPMSPLVASGLVEKLSEAGLLSNADSEPHTYRIVRRESQADAIDERDADQLLEDFSDFAGESLEKIGLTFEPEGLSGAFLHRLTSAQFLTFSEKREKNYFQGKTLSLKKVEDDELDAFHIDQALDVLSAEFALRVLEKGGSAALLLTKLMTGALIAEVVLTLQTPSSGEVLSNVKVVFDGPLILDLLDLSTPELRDYAGDLFELIEKSRIHKIVFSHIVEEMKGTLRGPLEALQRGDQPFGPLGNRIRVDPSHAAYARATLANLETQIKALGFEIIDADAFTTPDLMRHCDDALEEGLRNNIGPLMENLERRIRDARSISTVLRARALANAAKSIVESEWILVTRNDAVAAKSHNYLLMKKVIERDGVPPAITDRRLAGYLWFAVGGSLGALSQKKLVANCSYVLSPRTDVVSKVRQYLTELDPQKANLFMTLMRDERAQRCLVHSTLGFPSAVSQDNAEQLLEEVRRSVASELKEEADAREEELRRKHAEELSATNWARKEEQIAKDAELLKLRDEMKEKEAAASKELDTRDKSLAEFSQRLRGLESAHESDIDARIDRASVSARRLTYGLKAGLVLIYLLIVAVAYLFSPKDGSWALFIVIAVAMLGYWIIPQITYEKLSRPLWIWRLHSRCRDLGVLEHLEEYELDGKKLSVTKRPRR